MSRHHFALAPAALSLALAPQAHAHGFAGNRFFPGTIAVGAEAIIPINDESGDDVGLAVQAHFFLDDLFPHSLGRPIFGGAR